MPAHEELAAEVAAIPWYHTIELAPGRRHARAGSTPGRSPPRSRSPRRWTGKRCLDVGTFDGFWAFEMERRGAAEVVAIDVLDPARWDWPAGSEAEVRAAIGERAGGRRGVRDRQARRSARGSSASSAASTTSTPSEVGQLRPRLPRQPAGAPARPGARARAGSRRSAAATLIVVDGIDLPLSLLFPRRPVARFDGRGRPWWWYANAAGLGGWSRRRGFELVPSGRGGFTSRRARASRCRRRRRACCCRRPGRQALVDRAARATPTPRSARGRALLDPRRPPGRA